MEFKRDLFDKAFFDIKSLPKEKIEAVKILEQLSTFIDIPLSDVENIDEDTISIIERIIKSNDEDVDIAHLAASERFKDLFKAIKTVEPKVEDLF